MGEALVGGLVSSGWAEVGELHVVEPDGDRRADLEAAVPGLSRSLRAESPERLAHALQLL